MQRQGSTARAVPLNAPAVDVLFRPEQQHGLSGKDYVLIPLTRRHGKVDDSLRPEQPAFLHVEDNFVIATSAGGINSRVLVQHGRDSQGIPDAVAIPGPLAGSDRKGCGHGRKRSGSPEFSSILQDESVGLSQSLQRGPDFAHFSLARRRSKRCRRLRHCRRPTLADEVSIDILAQVSVVGFRAWGVWQVQC